LIGLKARKISLHEVDGGERRGARQIMALIKSFEEKRMDRNSIHDGTDATYATFERDGRKFIQIDSCGRAEREMPARRVKRCSWMRSPLASYSTSGGAPSASAGRCGAVKC
jgi:hypothetical protein